MSAQAEPGLRREQWDKSYARCENHVFYPKQECVKFLNRYVRRKLGPGRYQDLLDFGGVVRGLDLGCGLGGQVVLLDDFGLEAHGLDISAEAAARAREHVRALGRPELAERIAAYDGLTLPFADGFFQVALCERVLDSMPFALARRLMAELDRVCTRYVHLTLVSGEHHPQGPDYDGEEEVDIAYERGTVQSYFSPAKLERLISGTGLSIIFARKITEESLAGEYRIAEFVIVLEKPLVADEQAEEAGRQG